MISDEEKEFIGALQNKHYIIIRLTKLPYGGSIHNRPIWGEYGLPIVEKSEWMTRGEMILDSRYNGYNEGWFSFYRETAKEKGLI